MSAVRFILVKDRKDIDRVLEQGGKPADVYCNTGKGCLYIVDREGIPVPLVEVASRKIEMKIEEGSWKINSKSDWYKDFPLLKGVFEKYGQD